MGSTTHSENMADDSVMRLSTLEAEIPILGTITGLCYQHHHNNNNNHAKVCQYLGIPYASIPGRFRRSQAAAVPWPNRRFDGTRLGPYCPQPARDFYPIPVPARPWLETPTTSEVECLNLNISVPLQPEEHLDHSLPVMVFLHGGAFTYAAGSAAIYDGRELARISAIEGIPTIIVTINYRLGVLGFLASRVIKAYNESFGESGVGNYGIWDQVQALRWVRDHISGFGGNPDRVTLFGQSAGGVSGNAHLLRDEPLFSSVILQSGLLPLCGIMSVGDYDAVYRKTLAVLGISDTLDEHQQLQCLLQVPEQRLTASMTDVFMAPVVTLSLCNDGDLIKSPWPSYDSFNKFKLPVWCPRLVIGDAASETIIWSKTWREKLITPNDLMLYASCIIRPHAAKTLLGDIYDLSDHLSREQTFELIEKFTSDALYVSPAYDAARACISQNEESVCYLCHFDEASAYDTEWKGRAHHSLENVFIWSVLRDTLPLAQQGQSERMCKMWLQFANGMAPWEEFRSAERMMVFGAPKSGEATLRTAQEDHARGYQRWRRVREAGLTEEWGVLADNICMRRKDLVDLAVSPVAMEVIADSKGGVRRNDSVHMNGGREPGVL